jgi:hypothetical protein
MEALGALAVAERDIRALSTARADSGPLSDSAPDGRRDPASPFQSARGMFREDSYRTNHVETACATDIIPGGLKGRGPVP